MTERQTLLSHRDDDFFDVEAEVPETTYGAVVDRANPSLQGPGVQAASAPYGVDGSPCIYSKLYKRRWWVLLIYSLMAFMQGGLANVWAVIAQSVEPAFGWSDFDISIMMIWVYVTFVLSIIPFSWLMDSKGIRLSVVLTAALLVIGTGLRCITSTQPAVTWLAHAAHIAIGLAGPVSSFAGPVISALWFPASQRTTATAIATISGFAGGAGVFMVGPSIVDPPVHANLTPPSSQILSNYTNLDDIREQIMHLRYSECALCVAIFLAVLVYFPNKPPTPPSRTAAMNKLNFVKGFKQIFKKSNRHFWLIALPYALSVSIYGIWSALLDVNLKPLGVSELEAGRLGFYSVTAGCIAGIFIGRLADVLVGQMKLLLLILNAGCIITTLICVFIVDQYIPFSKEVLYTACILQGLFNNGAVPLYYELAIEGTYPVAEAVTSGMLTLIYNIPPLLFLVVFFIPHIGTQWMNWFIFSTVLVAFPMVLFFKERYRRLDVDQAATSQEPEDTDDVTS